MEPQPGSLPTNSKSEILERVAQALLPAGTKAVRAGPPLGDFDLLEYITSESAPSVAVFDGWELVPPILNAFLKESEPLFSTS
jgi:hypothetical protein